MFDISVGSNADLDPGDKRMRGENINENFFLSNMKKIIFILTYIQECQFKTETYNLSRVGTKQLPTFSFSPHKHFLKYIYLNKLHNLPLNAQFKKKNIFVLQPPSKSVTTRNDFFRIRINLFRSFGIRVRIRVKIKFFDKVK